MSEQDRKPTDDPALPASEAGTGLTPEDKGGDTSKPASEADALADEPEGGEAQSWPGRDFGTIPPPG